ncbi:MAG: hypothetical protein ACRDTE_09935 [Pseudonocardiaceae bacterium]
MATLDRRRASGLCGRARRRRGGQVSAGPASLFGACSDTPDPPLLPDWSWPSRVDSRTRNSSPAPTVARTGRVDGTPGGVQPDTGENGRRENE